MSVFKNKDLCGIQEGYQAFVLKKLMRMNNRHCHIVPTDVQIVFLKEVLSLVAPDLKVVVLPEWDTVPYDRVSPRLDIEGERIETLSILARNFDLDEKILVLTTPAGLLQKVPDISFIFYSNKIM